jgi:copper chaperone CopZ
MQESSYFHIPEIGGRHGVKKLKRELDKIPGVRSVAVKEATGRVAVDYDATATETSKIERAIADLGYGVQPVSYPVSIEEKKS